MSHTPLYGLRVAATGAMLLSMGALLVLLMFRTTLGPFAFGGLRVAEPKWKVALFSPGAGAERTRAKRRWKERLEGRFRLSHWEHFDTAALARNPALVLIVDGATLNLRRAQELRRFVRRGGRLALFGVLDANSDGAPTALSTLLDRVVEPARDFRWTLLPGSEGPLSAGFSAAERLPLRRVVAAYSLPGRRAEVTWLGSDSRAPRRAAALRDTPGTGRLVWWSVRPDGALDRVEVQAAMTRVVRASMAWLLEEPFAEILPGTPDQSEHLQRVEARIEARAAGRFLLSLTNRNREAGPPLELRIHLNHAANVVAVHPTTVVFGGDATDPIEDLRLLRAVGGERVVAFRGPPLGGGESRSFYVDLK